LLAVACGGDSSDPGQNDRLTVLAGHSLADTISMTPAQGLVVRLRDEDGKPEVGIEVRFEAPTASRMLVSTVGGFSFGTVAGAVTDAEGRAAVRTQFSTRAGDGWISITVPVYGLVDTVRYTIRPGAAVRVQLSPRDTVLSLDGTFTFRGSTVDRAGNARTDPATYEVVGSAIRLTPTGLATADSVGIVRVRIRAAIGSVTATDSGTVAVVPSAQVMWSNGFDLIMGTLNGSTSRTVIRDALAATPEPQGNRIVFTRLGLMVIDTLGVGGPVATPGFSYATYPEWSRDGWIYFHGETIGGVRIARIRPDGTGIELLAPAGSAYATPSPDGRSVAYAERGMIRILDLQTRTVRTVVNSDNGSNPRWSPTGDRVAFIRNSRLWVARVDGSPAQEASTAPVGSTGITWSPDARWILAQQRLIDVNTGFHLVISWVGDYPAWRK
jgi:hypothetical protein